MVRACMEYHIPIASFFFVNRMFCFPEIYHVQYVNPIVKINLQFSTNVGF